MGCALYGHVSGRDFAACSSCRINYNTKSIIKTELGVLSNSWKMSNHLELYLTSHFYKMRTVKFCSWSFLTFRWNLINTLLSSALKIKYTDLWGVFSFHHPQTQTASLFPTAHFHLSSTYFFLSFPHVLYLPGSLTALKKKSWSFKTNKTTNMDRKKSLVQIRWCKLLDCGRNLEYLEEVRNIQTPHRRMEMRSVPLHRHTPVYNPKQRKHWDQIKPPSIFGEVIKSTSWTLICDLIKLILYLNLS